jgi:plastocyanin
MKAILVALLLAVSVAATPKPAQHHGSTPQHRLIIVRMDTDFRPHKRSPFGKLLGYDPVEVHAHMGDKIQFVNPDDENHTATGMSYTGQQLPANYKFQSDFTKRRGRIIDASEWSTGTVREHGGKSQVFVTKRTGHYFFACGYHRAEGMAGVIVVEP